MDHVRVWGLVARVRDSVRARVRRGIVRTVRARGGWTVEYSSLAVRDCDDDIGVEPARGELRARGRRMRAKTLNHARGVRAYSRTPRRGARRRRRRMRL